MRVSVKISQVMVINGDASERNEWRMGDRIIERTDEYKYLSVTLNTYGVEKAKNNIYKSNQWYGRLASVARYRANKYVTVRELWKTLAVPIGRSPYMTLCNTSLLSIGNESVRHTK